MTSPRILLCDDEPNLRKVLGAILQQEGFEVHAEADGESALARLRAAPSGTFDAVISDLRMPRLDGIGLLKHVLVVDPDLPVVFLTAHGTVDSAVEAVKLGAFDYLEKPFDRAQIKQVLDRAVATRARTGASTGHDPAPPEADPCLEVGMVGASREIREVREVIRTAAASPSTVLVTGESGTGKELVARALHLGSDRANGPFIRVNCAAIPAGLVESELFGHERGAFTGASSLRRGVFEQADSGTLFLDEVAELPLDMQTRLLRVLETWEVRRVGGERAVPVDVRLVCATHRDLRSMVSVGEFRADLYYRIARLVLEVPPLRERSEDVPALAEHFLCEIADEVGRRVLSEEAMARLLSHPWPGNARELRNVIGAAAAASPSERIEAQDVEQALERVAGPGRVGAPNESALLQVVNSHRGNPSAAARALGIPRSTLRDRLKGLRKGGEPDERHAG